ncbi:hypothetical protein QT609_22510, partial [Xanthomonas citri pv. citri]
FGQAVIDPQRVAELEKVAERIKVNKARYQAIETKSGVPWYFVGLLHYRCCDGDFSLHLNGDPLSNRTVNVPKGRPLQGDAPFSWEDSAIDLIGLYRLQNADWSSVGTVLYRLESVNGFGYRTHNVKSPFLWACTNLYTSGNFVGDHTFDPSFKDTQCG